MGHSDRLATAPSAAMSGHNMTIVGPQCTADMGRCVYVCPPGQNVCKDGYTLVGCDFGSQPGARPGQDHGAPGGGCSGMGNGAALLTFLY